MNGNGQLGGFWEGVGSYLVEQGKRVATYYVNQATAPEAVSPAPMIMLPAGTPGTYVQQGSVAPTGGDMTKILLLFGAGLLAYSVLTKGKR
jgi:hypothetical protein